MRVLLLSIVVCTVSLLAFTGWRQNDLALTLAERMAGNIAREVEARPVDHRHTLFSGLLVAQLRSASPYVVGADTGRVAPYELVAMSPCNPRIHACR